MQFDSLLEFCTIAEIRNFTVAAERLFISESSLSRRIKKLEEELGAPLLKRTTRHIELTTLGKTFLPYAQRGVALKSEMDAALAKLLHTEKTHLNIAAVDASSEYVSLASLLAMFKEEFPHITVNIQRPNLPISSLISENICEMGFGPELSGYEDKNYNRLHIKSDRIIALIPKTHPLAGKKSISIMDLVSERLILTSTGSPMFDLCVQACQVHGFQPNVILTIPRGIRTVAEYGIGIGLMLEYPLSHQSQDLLIENKVICVPLEPPVCVDFNLTYAKKPSQNANAFIDFLKRTLKIPD